jgi:hypothetical protein
MLVGIGLMLASGVLLVLFPTWLRSAANRLAQTAGVLLASVVAVFCGGLALILLGDNRLRGLRLGGSITVIVLIGLTVAAVAGTRRGLRKA